LNESCELSGGSLAVRADVCVGTLRASYDPHQPRRLLYSAIKEAPMGKANKTFFSSKNHKPSALGTIVSDGGWRVKDASLDQRVTHFLMLMRQIDESAGGLGILPMSELSEIVCSAIELCGFSDPVEARDVIKTVLQTIELSNKVPRLQEPDSALLPPD